MRGRRGARAARAGVRGSRGTCRLYLPGCSALKSEKLTLLFLLLAVISAVVRVCASRALFFSTGLRLAGAPAGGARARPSGGAGRAHFPAAVVTAAHPPAAHLPLLGLVGSCLLSGLG